MKNHTLKVLSFSEDRPIQTLYDSDGRVVELIPGVTSYSITFQRKDGQKLTVPVCREFFCFAMGE